MREIKFRGWMPTQKAMVYEISVSGKQITNLDTFFSDTDVQMSVNGDVSQDEIAMARFIYKAHIKHIIKKIGSAIIPPNPINGTLPSETDSATK